MKLISINNRRYIGSKFRMINFIKETMKKELNGITTKKSKVS